MSSLNSLVLIFIHAEWDEAITCLLNILESWYVEYLVANLGLT